MPFLFNESIMKIVYLVLFLISSSACVAQNIYSNGGGSGVIFLKPLSEASPANMKRGSYVGPHVLGDSVTFLLNNFEKLYVYYKTSSGAYPVEEKVVLKRNIYKKVHDFDSFISKSYQANLVNGQEATGRLKKVLNIGIKLMSYDTNLLEKEVKKIDLPTDFERYLLELQFK
jgi:hypothetical protein